MSTVRILDNGIRTIIQNIPYLNSATIGIIVESGSFYEGKSVNGVSHFIEHMLFKGTEKRTARDIAESIDEIGGQLNAFTSKELTCYYAKVLGEHVPIAVDVLSDMLKNSKFDVSEISKEKGVIIEEINMYLDFPEDLVFENLTEMLYGKMNLANPILGTELSVSSLDKNQILDYFHEMYNPDKIVISMVGNIDEQSSFDLLNEYFGDYKAKAKTIANNFSYNYEPVANVSGIVRDIEQFNLCMGFPGPSSYSDDIFSLSVVNNILGGNMSSRLFQEIRENLGLAYNIESSLTSYYGAGMMSIYTGLNYEQVLKTAALIRKELDNIKKNYINKEEIRKSREYLKGSYILSLESSFNKMYESGKYVLYGMEIESAEDIIRQINAVDTESVIKVIDKYMDLRYLNTSYVGNVKNKEKFENDLKEILM